jgi:hypothetical protein
LENTIHDAIFMRAGRLEAVSDGSVRGSCEKLMRQPAFLPVLARR